MRNATRGVCPHCGYDSGSTICKTKKLIYTIVNEGTFFFRKIKYIGKDEFLKQWIEKYNKS